MFSMYFPRETRRELFDEPGVNRSGSRAGSSPPISQDLASGSGTLQAPCASGPSANHLQPSISALLKAVGLEKRCFIGMFPEFKEPGKKNHRESWAVRPQCRCVQTCSRATLHRFRPPGCVVRIEALKPVVSHQLQAIRRFSNRQLRSLSISITKAMRLQTPSFASCYLG